MCSTESSGLLGMSKASELAFHHLPFVACVAAREALHFVLSSGEHPVLMSCYIVHVHEKLVSEAGGESRS